MTLFRHSGNMWHSAVLQRAQRLYLTARILLFHPSAHLLQAPCPCLLWWLPTYPLSPVLRLSQRARRLPKSKRTRIQFQKGQDGEERRAPHPLPHLDRPCRRKMRRYTRRLFQAVLMQASAYTTVPVISGGKRR